MENTIDYNDLSKDQIYQALIELSKRREHEKYEKLWAFYKEKFKNEN